jgi:phage virion morphogenesis protein
MNVGVIIDDREVRAALDKLAAKCRNMKPLMSRIGGYYEGRVLENFKNESDPEGHKWPRLSPVTLMMALAKKKGFKKKGTLSAKGRNFLQRKSLLFQSGALYDSIHFQANNDGVKIGTRGGIKYSRIHQFGGMAGRGHKVRIPARPYLAMNDGTDNMRLALRDQRAILDLVTNYLEP